MYYKVDSNKYYTPKCPSPPDDEWESLDEEPSTLIKGVEKLHTKIPSPTVEEQEAHQAFIEECHAKSARFDLVEARLKIIRQDIDNLIREVEILHGL